MKLEMIKRINDYTIICYEKKKMKTQLVPLRIINELCIDNLSTYQGRKEAIKIKYGIKTMVPIYINDEILLFPTKGIKEYACVWINYHQIREVQKGKIVLQSGKLVECEPFIIQRQLKNCFEIAF